MDRFINDDIKIENKYFSIYSDDNELELYPVILNELTNKRKEILEFLNIEDFPKTRVNFYRNKDNIINFRTQLGEVPYQINSKAGFFHDNEIYAYVDKEKVHNGNIPILFAHEYTHLVYQNLIQQNNRITWIDEGLAQYISGERGMQEKYPYFFKYWYYDSIIRRDKELPKIEYLYKHGSKYGSFVDNETNKYNGYSISYLIVKYLVEKYKDKFSELIKNEEKIYNIEPNIINETIEYYNNLFRPDLVPDFNELSTPEELMDYMNLNILYGWVDNENKEHLNDLKGFKPIYHTMSIEEILSYKVGTCIDQVQLEKYFFDKYNIENKIYCHRLYREEIQEGDNPNMHCFLIFHMNDNWYFFEHSNCPKRGIHKFDSLEDALNWRISNEFNDRVLTEIPEIPVGLTINEFNKYVNSFESINIENIRNKKR